MRKLLLYFIPLLVAMGCTHRYQKNPTPAVAEIVSSAKVSNLQTMFAIRDAGRSLMPPIVSPSAAQKSVKVAYDSAVKTDQLIDQSQAKLKTVSQAFDTQGEEIQRTGDENKKLKASFFSPRQKSLGAWLIILVCLGTIFRFIGATQLGPVGAVFSHISAALFGVSTGGISLIPWIGEHVFRWKTKKAAGTEPTT
jgi:hypothetical protein